VKRRDLVKPYLVFDMDGVLVDVTESYRETIRRTVEHFTGEPVSAEAIQDLKNQGGWNDDWRLSHHIVANRGIEVALPAVVEYFQGIFRGNGSGGLILQERWIARPGLLERLAEAYRLALFTGRECEEAAFTLARFAPHLRFSPLVGMESVERHKPHPEGLLKIVGAEPDSRAWYVGDAVDDARCASAAGVPFIGIAAPSSPRRHELVEAFRAEGVSTVIEDINSLEDVLPL
jgi:HAD superfamily phosphatase